MTVLIARSGYSPSGGAEKYLQRLARGLIDSGIEPVLIAHPKWPKEAWPGNRIERVPDGGPAAYAEAVNEKKKQFPGAPLFSFARVPGADLYRAGDGVHACWLRRLAAEENRLATWFRRTRSMHRQVLALERELLQGNSTPRVIAISQMVADELEAEYGFPSERIKVIPPGYTAPSISPNERERARQQTRSELGIPADANVIIFVGTGWKRKGATVLAEAFQKLGHRDTHLILLGKGRLKISTPPRTHIMGPIRDPKPYLFAADIFTLPSLYDPFSNACLEAAAFGLPVLTTDAVGFSEALRQFPGAGEVVPVPRSSAAWTAALDRWLEPERVRAAQEPLANLSRAYTLENSLAATLDQLTQLATERP